MAEEPPPSIQEDPIIDLNKTFRDALEKELTPSGDAMRDMCKAGAIWDRIKKNAKKKQDPDPRDIHQVRIQEGIEPHLGPTAKTNLELGKADQKRANQKRREKHVARLTWVAVFTFVSCFFSQARAQNMPELLGTSDLSKSRFLGAVEVGTAPEVPTREDNRCGTRDCLGKNQPDINMFTFYENEQMQIAARGADPHSLLAEGSLGPSAATVAGNAGAFEDSAAAGVPTEKESRRDLFGLLGRSQPDINVLILSEKEQTQSAKSRDKDGVAAGVSTGKGNHFETLDLPGKVSVTPKRQLALGVSRRRSR